MNKRTAKRIRQNNHRLYHESVKCELKFKQAVKALLIIRCRKTTKRGAR